MAMYGQAYDPRDSREWWCRLTLQGLAASFVVVGGIFLSMPDVTIRALNANGAWFGDFTPLPISSARFWLTLATGYMTLVAALAYMAQRDLRRHRDLLGLLALGKAVTSLSGLGFYLYATDAFIYLANFFVDGAITVTVLVIWAIVPSLGPPRDSARPPARSDGGPVAQDPVGDSIAEAMVPAGGPFEEGAARTAVFRDVTAFVSGTAPFAPQGLRFALWLIEVSPLFVPPLQMRRFSRLPLDRRVKILEAWEGSRFLLLHRLIVHGLKLLVMTHFYAKAEIEARLGYPHPLERVPRPKEHAL